MHATSSLPSLQLSNPSHISSAGIHWSPLAHENSVGPHVGAVKMAVKLYGDFDLDL